ncbi:MAG: hypothetical protein PWP64_312 [Candidatus Cloacimonadota bacterium]|nr:hypothetical protein [Candidatus Cloacimonadota bacterium]
MKVVHYDQVELEEVNVEGAKDAKIRWLISQKDGAPNFAMRMFEVKPQGHTPYHQHDWEHEIYCLSGKGNLITERGETPFAENDILYVDPGMMHSFKNVGHDTLKFLCLIPNEKPVVKKNLNPFSDETANNC